MFKQICIIGTTASGKTSLAIEIAEQFGGVILSLDSLCLYKLIDIASAKPTRDELSRIKHFGVNEIYPDEHFSAGKFFEIYKTAHTFALQNNCPLIITGGSGFYLKAMMSGLSPDVPKFNTNLSNDEIYKLALSLDPKFALKFSQNDSYRLEKWYQIYKFSGETPSVWLKKNTKEPIIKEIPIFEIEWDREILKKRISQRTKNMLESGLIDEAKMLFNMYDSKIKPLKSIGLKECGEYLSGKYDLNELETLISTHTAQLAKRQRTFNRSAFPTRKSTNLVELKKLVTAELKTKTQ